MPFDPNGNITGTSGSDLLWGTAIVLGDGSYDNSSDRDSGTLLGALRGFGGDDILYGDLYYDGDDATEGDELYGGDGNDTLYGDCGPEDPNWLTNNNGSSDVLYGEAGNDLIYGQAGGDIIYGGADNDQAWGGLGADNLHGDDGDDQLWGEDGGDTLWGDAGSDELDGGEGDDTLIGGANNGGVVDGNDYLYGRAGNDSIEGSGGNDIIYGGIGDDYLEGDGLSSNADGDDFIYGEAGNDTLIGDDGNDGLYGGAEDDRLIGGSGNDVLDGGTGADLFDCGIGNDTYIIDSLLDGLQFAFADSGVDLVQSSVNFSLNVYGNFQENLTLLGTAANGTGNGLANLITGNSAANMLLGLDGDDQLFGLGDNDTLDGGAGVDRMSGGTGNDTYWIDNAGDVAVEANGQGTDNVQSYVSFNMGGQELENLALRGAASINGTGNSIANVISGNSGVNVLIGLGGNDTLDAKEGADTMQGGIGNDTYYVDNTGDHVIEVNGQGTDNVQTYVSFNLSGQEIENLALRGAASINGTGNSIANTISGNSGNNIIDGLGGADTMSGAQGNDTYFVDNAGDHVIELNGGGIDNVHAYVGFNLTGQEIENLALRGAASINGTGNSIANIITGNSGANIINGLGGNDTLTGAQGQDSFVFNTALNASTNVDTITDFSVVDDTIQLDNAIFAALGANGTLNANQFVKNTTGLAGDGDDHIIYETDTGWLTYDSNGSTAGGSIHFATLASNLALTNADFVVV